jgi:hypothetical protein
MATGPRSSAAPLLLPHLFSSAPSRAALTSAGARDGTAAGGLARTPSHAALGPTQPGGGFARGFTPFTLASDAKVVAATTGGGNH